MDDSQPFWKRLALSELSKEQWESLCDGCGKCCLHKLQDEETDELLFTSISCEFLNTGTCRCGVYQDRNTYVPDCLNLDASMLEDVSSWLPETCAYRILYQGGELPAWHHLVCEDTQVIHIQQASVRDKVISEKYVDEDDWQDYVL